MKTKVKSKKLFWFQFFDCRLQQTVCLFLFDLLLNLTHGLLTQASFTVSPHQRFKAQMKTVTHWAYKKEDGNYSLCLTFYKNADLFCLFQSAKLVFLQTFPFCFPPNNFLWISEHCSNVTKQRPCKTSKHLFDKYLIQNGVFTSYCSDPCTFRCGRPSW